MPLDNPFLEVESDSESCTMFYVLSTRSDLKQSVLRMATSYIKDFPLPLLERLFPLSRSS